MVLGMPRFARSLILGLLLGSLAGLYFGWLQFPPDARDRKISELSQPYRDEYMVMIAAAYAADGDVPGALERLSPLELEDIPSSLQRTTERVISTSARSLDDIRLLVQLAHELSALTPMMQPFLVMESGDR